MNHKRKKTKKKQLTEQPQNESGDTVKSVYDFCVENNLTELLDEWDVEKNLPLTPQNASYGSANRIWWKCSKGHEFRALFNDRARRHDGCPYCSGKRVIPGETDFATLYPQHAKLWHPTKNGDLSPNKMAPKSRALVWWQCQKGHEWQQRMYHRIRRTPECPICNGTTLAPGINDLATLYPSVAAEWHLTKNGELTQQDVSPCSNLKVWWICKEGHEWQQIIYDRVYGNGCPICSNRILLSGYNDLATRYPELKKQWHPTKNGNLTPDKVACGSSKPVWWICEHGHSWSAAPQRRTGPSKSGCPYCDHKKAFPGETDLKTLFPELAEEWNYEKNGSLTPDNITAYSNKKVWWVCSLGHEWEAIVRSRSSRHDGCPYCGGKRVLVGFNDLATKEPEIAAEWHPTKNGALTPQMFTVGSKAKVWWQCDKGHEWKTAIHSRTGPSRTGCRECWFDFVRTGRSKRKKIVKKFDVI